MSVERSVWQWQPHQTAGRPVLGLPDMAARATVTLRPCDAVPLEATVRWGGCGNARANVGQELACGTEFM